MEKKQGTKCKSMWFGDEVNGNLIEIVAFLQIFKQLKTLTIFMEWWKGNGNGTEYKDSIRINDEFMRSLGANR